MPLTDKERTYYIALIILYIMKDQDDYRDISNLALILDEHNFDNLIDHYGGMTITIPTREEVNSALRALIVYQENCLNNRRIDYAIKDSGMNIQDATKVIKYVKAIDSVLSKINLDLLK